MMRLSLQAAALAIPCALSACTGEGLDLGTTESAIDISVFSLPSLSELDRAQIVHRYDALDPGNLVPRGLLEDAVIYFDVNRTHIPKQSHLVVVDLSPFSGKDRFWLVDLASGAVEPHHVAHGDGSDPDNDGIATLFSNTSGSHMSSLGFYLTAEIYDGTHPHSMRLDGLSPDGSPNDMANTLVRERAVVVHEADYVDDSTTSRSGRSNGCLALDPSIEVSVVDRIHDGSLIYTAITPLNTPVGRATCGDGVCDGAETADACAADCATDVPTEPTPPGDEGGCAVGGNDRGIPLVLALGLVLSRRRRRSR